MDEIDAKLAKLEEALGITENKKKKKVCSSETYTTGSPTLNAQHFNKAMGTDKPLTPSEPKEVDHFLGTTSSQTGEATGETGGEAGGGEACAESLTESTMYVTRLSRVIELPDDIKLIRPIDVANAVAVLEPTESFRVGYCNYLYIFKELEEFISIIKCTEFEGFTGLDWADSNQMAAAQAEYNDDVTYTPSGLQSTDYADGATNRIVQQKAAWSHKDELGNTVIDNDSRPGSDTIDLDTILYYPDTRKKPIVKYYADIKGSGLGYILVDRDYLYKEIIKRLENKVEWWKKTYGMLPKYKRPADKWSKLLTDDKINKIKSLILMDRATTGETNLGAQWGYSNQAGSGDIRPQVRALYTNQIYYLHTPHVTYGKPLAEINPDVITYEGLETPLTEKRETKRYYVRPQDIFCANKKDVLKALVDVYNAGENCTVYSLKNLDDHDDVHKLSNDAIIYYYDDGVLKDKNKVPVLDYDLYIKHEEERNKVSDNGEDLTQAEWNNNYDDRMTQNTELEENAKLAESADYGAFGYRIKNVSDFGKTQKYIVARYDSEGDALWFYGAWNDKAKADACARELNSYGGGYPAKVIPNTNLPGWNAVTRTFDESCKKPLKESSLTLASEKFNDGYYIECRWDKYAGYEVIQGTVYKDDPSMVQDDSHKSYYSKEAAMSAYRRLYNKHKRELAARDVDNPFDTTFESYNAYGTRLVEGKEEDTCCICGEPLDGYGNNAEPYMDGTCCDACNLKFVIPARLNLMIGTDKYNSDKEDFKD